MKRTLSFATIILLLYCCNKEPEKKPISPNVKIEFRMAAEDQTDGFEEKILDGKKIYLNPIAEMTEKDIAFAYKSNENNAYTSLNLELKKDAAIKFGFLTEKNISKMMAIMINGNLIMAPIIQAKIPGGKIAISSSMTETQVDSLLNVLTH